MLQYKTNAWTPHNKIFFKFYRVNSYLAGVDANIDGGAIGLLPLDPLDVDPELAPVALHDLADLHFD